MKSRRLSFPGACLLLGMLFLASSCLYAKDVVRPEEIKSLRLVVYDRGTYGQLAGQWQEYYNAYPSEYAYANWMRAADYAQDPDLPELLDKGLAKYPANPVLLYLKAAQQCGKHNDLEGRAKLERAVALDPDFIDPWFMLVTQFMDARDNERLDVALQHILESGVITDEVIDYNFNMISLLEPDAILITNGDNDTFPGWILTRILDFRPDVAIVNRSLLNTDWYPLYVIENGLPRFIERAELDSLRDFFLNEVKLKKKKATSGIFSDSLILRIVTSAARAGRPVYLAKTLYLTDDLVKLIAGGTDLGLVTLVTKSAVPEKQLLNKAFNDWMKNFRVGGLESWRLRNSPASDAGRSLVSHYGIGIADNLASLKTTAPDLIPPLFDWYTRYVEDVLSQELQGKVARAWCSVSNTGKIDAWCKKQGLN